MTIWTWVWFSLLLFKKFWDCWTHLFLFRFFAQVKQQIENNGRKKNIFWSSNSNFVTFKLSSGWKSLSKKKKKGIYTTFPSSCEIESHLKSKSFLVSWLLPSNKTLTVILHHFVFYLYIPPSYVLHSLAYIHRNPFEPTVPPNESVLFSLSTGMHCRTAYQNIWTNTKEKFVKVHHSYS